MPLGFVAWIDSQYPNGQKRPSASTLDLMHRAWHAAALNAQSTQAPSLARLDEMDEIHSTRAGAPHSPLPFSEDPEGEHEVRIEDAKGRVIARTSVQDAPFIVLACNSHATQAAQIEGLKVAGHDLVLDVQAYLNDETDEMPNLTAMLLALQAVGIYPGGGEPIPGGPSLPAPSSPVNGSPDLRAALAEMVEQFGHYVEHTEDPAEVAALIGARATLAGQPSNQSTVVEQVKTAFDTLEQERKENGLGDEETSVQEVIDYLSGKPGSGPGL